MPRPRPLCPAHSAAFGRLLTRSLPCAAALLTASTAVAETQIWSVRGLGIKVGELRIDASEDANRYRGTGAFNTTGLAGILRRIRFSVSSHGRITENAFTPLSYVGFIDTGKRVSETELQFDDGRPLKTKGTDAPAVAISDAAKQGAQDPMTVMWRILRDQDQTTVCAIDQTQFDGTRLVRITLMDQTREADTLTCAGTYERIGGYSNEELSELKASPLIVTYRLGDDDIWRAEHLRVTTRHGAATLKRLD
ncbi:DUF3108 domain-containing protein [Shimia abyssi]|uniref:Uncharacterized protein DUF3108 n=1 Tax=Shimia abyssi TaxID=1662395 RepID=A0A2P8F8T6_9RHOB|nr:DUF3108 domain-containing protein [Shimia abyssi]PSL18140.1 uncharacterized protein DUF3108 [Shimia abyssi]